MGFYFKECPTKILPYAETEAVFRGYFFAM